MSDLLDEVTAQLSRELGAAAWDLGGLVGPEEAMAWQRRITQCSPAMAKALLSPDDSEAAQAVIDFMNVRWPDCTPEDVDPQWWRTPLGRICARSLGHDTAEAVTHSVAAAMLGVTKGTVSQLVHRGTLDRHPDGGVLRASVLQRIARTVTDG